MPSPPANPKCEYYGCIPSTTAGRAPLKGPNFNLLNPSADHTVPTVYQLDDLPSPPWDCLRVVMISDTHEQHRGVALPSGDLLLHCGDVQLGCWPFHRPRKQLRDFFKWFRGQPHPVKVFIAGNHDRLLRHMTAAEVRREVAPALYLLDESCVVEPVGLRLYGTPRSIENSKLSPNTAFQSKQAWAPFPSPTAPPPPAPAVSGITQLQRGAPLTARLEGTTPAGPVDILLTHQSLEVATVCPVAQQPITAYVQQVAPRRLHVAGHLHLSHGLHRVPLPETKRAPQAKEETDNINTNTNNNNNNNTHREEEAEAGGTAAADATTPAQPFIPSINASLLIFKGLRPTLLMPCVVDIQM